MKPTKNKENNVSQLLLYNYNYAHSIGFMYFYFEQYIQTASTLSTFRCWICKLSHYYNKYDLTVVFFMTYLLMLFT